MTAIRNLSPIWLVAFLALSCLEPNRDSVWSVEKVMTLSTKGYCRSAVVVNDTAYVAAGQAGIQIWDLSGFLSSGTTSSRVMELDMYASGLDFENIIQVEFLDGLNVVLAVENNSLVHILDKVGSDSLNWDSAKMSEKTREIRAKEDTSGFTIYAADNDDGLKWNFFELQSWGEWLHTTGNELVESGSPTGIDIKDDLLAVTTDQLGVSLYRLGDLKTDPVKLDSTDTQGSTDKVTLTEDGLFVAAEEGGAYYYPVSGSAIGSGIRFAEDLYVKHVTIEEDMAILSLGSGGLAVYDISDKNNPESRGIHEIGYVYRTTVESNYVLACTREGLQILTISK